MTTIRAKLCGAMRLGRVTMFACTLAITGACVSKPTLTVHHAEVSGVGPAGVGLTVFVQVNNRNSFDVMVRDVRAQVTMAGGIALAPIQFNPNVWLSADRSTQVAVPVVVPWGSIPALLTSTVGSDTISYRVKGAADVTATRLLNIQRNDEPLDESGEISRSLIAGAARTMFPGAH